MNTTLWAICKKFILGNFLMREVKNKIHNYFNENIDIVVSDMSQNTTGNKNLDSLVTGELCLEAMNFSKNILKYDGRFISKLFMGSTFNEIILLAKKNFKEVHIFKPPSTPLGICPSFKSFPIR